MEKLQTFYGWNVFQWAQALSKLDVKEPVMSVEEAFQLQVDYYAKFDLDPLTVRQKVHDSHVPLATRLMLKGWAAVEKARANNERVTFESTKRIYFNLKT